MSTARSDAKVHLVALTILTFLVYDPLRISTRCQPQPGSLTPPLPNQVHTAIHAATGAPAAEGTPTTAVPLTDDSSPAAVVEGAPPLQSSPTDDTPQDSQHQETPAPRKRKASRSPFEDEAQRFADSSNLSVFQRVAPGDHEVLAPRQAISTLPHRFRSLLKLTIERRRWNPSQESHATCRAYNAEINELYLSSKSVEVSERILSKVRGSIRGCRAGVAYAARVVADSIPETNKESILDKLILLEIEREIWQTASFDKNCSVLRVASTDILLFNSIIEFQRVHKVLIDKFREEFECNVPVVHTLPCPAGLKHSPDDIKASSLELLQCDSRNLMFDAWPTFVGGHASMAPYIPATWLDKTNTTGGKKILIDFGANHFFGSPKWIADNNEAAGAKFDKIVLVEPRAENVRIPEDYKAKYDIELMKGLVWIGLGKHTQNGKLAVIDPVLFIQETCKKEDYCVVKFDVDRLEAITTMEWGFMYSLISSPSALEVVDELYVELHFQFPAMRWTHVDHNMQQAIDLLSQLRKCGLAVHSWP